MSGYKRAEGYIKATGTTSASLDLPQVRDRVTVIDSILATTTRGATTGNLTIAVGGITVARKRLTAAGGAYIFEDFDGGWPVWRSSTILNPWVNPEIEIDPASPDQSTLTPIYGGVAITGEANQGVGQSFTSTVSFTLDAIAVYLQRVGNPTDNLLLEVTDTSISNAALDSATIAVDSIPTSPKWVFFPLASLVGAGGQLFIRLTRSGARDTTNYIAAITGTASSYAGGGAYTLDDTAWSAESATDDLGVQAFGPIPIALSAPSGSTGSYLGVTYHYERPSVLAG